MTDANEEEEIFVKIVSAEGMEVSWKLEVESWKLKATTITITITIGTHLPPISNLKSWDRTNLQNSKTFGN